MRKFLFTRIFRHFLYFISISFRFPFFYFIVFIFWECKTDMILPTHVNFVFVSHL
jgi:hypothetical protein